MNRAGRIALGLAALALTGVGAWRLFAGDDAPPPTPQKPAPRYEPDPDDRPRVRESLITGLPPQTPQSLPAGRVEERWHASNKAGIQALDAGEYDRAVQLFEDCRAANPDEKVFAQNLAEALARAASRELDAGSAEARQAALLKLRRAHELAPERADIAARLAQVEKLAESEQGLWTDTSEHFELAYDGERRELLWSAAQITTELEAAYQDLGERFARWPVENGRPRIRVVLYRRAGFLDATGIGHWAGGLYDGTIRVPVEELGREKREFERVLRHETVHAFVAEAGGRGVPGWLNEGLAQWLERRDAAERERTVGAARRVLKGKAFLPLTELEKSFASLKDEEKIGRAYQQSLALVDHIERNFGERLLYELVAGCREGRAPSATFETRTARPLDLVLADLGRELE
ncbi:MAG: hypothetical protein HZA53_03005 [Planctomycetes bacterium]|nr:hypothetical protein [Planctomycetota bacterium]